MKFNVKFKLNGNDKEININNCNSEYHAMVKLNGYLNKRYPNSSYEVISCDIIDTGLDYLKSIFGI